jgi:hypothetical protein
MRLLAILFLAAFLQSSLAADRGAGIDPNGFGEDGTGIDPHGIQTCYSACVDPNG